MSSSIYMVGQQIRLTATFTTPDGHPVDPTAVTFKVMDGAGVPTSYASPIKDSPGVYHQDILITDSGPWHYRAEGAGAAIAASEKTFLVSPSRF